MRLCDLMDGWPIGRRTGPTEGVITGLTDDSRQVGTGALFICRGPLNEQAHLYVAQAIRHGAAAVLTESPCDTMAPALPDTVTHLVAEAGIAVDQRFAGRLAERFYGHPARRLTAIGITGTNGKTTTAMITQHLLKAVGRRPGLIGTVHLDTGGPDGPCPAELTTPGAIELSRLLAEMVENGCDSVVMEVSSHALHQGRAEQLRFSAAALTNLTQDHLDYHGSMQAYADAKARLFQSLDADATAVLNGQDPWAEQMAQGSLASVVYSQVGQSLCTDPGPEAGCCIEPVRMSPSSSLARFTGAWGGFEAEIPLTGTHNLANALQAAALTYAVTRCGTESLREAMATCPPVPGRFEPVGPCWPKRVAHHTAPNLPTVLVDYAHTPDALEHAASALRPLLAEGGRLIVVFGCGGDRDRDKRPQMTRSACRHADVVVLTSDNPRTEDPRQILRDAAAGFDPGPSGTIRTPETHTIADRAQAIGFAIQAARPADTVLIAGKGHEDYQVVGTSKTPFDDRIHAAKALQNYTP